MKFAAFISIIVSLAVMIGACQGAVGKVGEGGDTGATGPTGPSGPSGPSGFTPLQLKGAGPFILISDKAASAVGDEETIDLSGYYRGGEDVTLSDPVRMGSEDDITAKRVGNMLTLTPDADGGYEINTFNVDATDTDGADVTIVIRARRNRAPTIPSSAGTATVGTQAPETAPDMTGACPMANECVTVLTFADADEQNGEDKLTFTATSEDMAKVEVVKVETAADGVTARVFIRGVASTWVADTDTTNDVPDEPGHKTVKITVTAMDEDKQGAVDTDGDSATGTINVTVDGAPQADGTMPDRSIKMSHTGSLVNNVRAFFKDPEDQTANLTFTAKTDKPAVAAANIENDNELHIDTVAPGTTMVTVTATEPSGDPVQSQTQTFMLTVSD
jgi:hypothetical protein